MPARQCGDGGGEMIRDQGMGLVRLDQVADHGADAGLPVLAPFGRDLGVEQIQRAEQVEGDQGGDTVGAFMGEGLFQAAIAACQAACGLDHGVDARQECRGAGRVWPEAGSPKARQAVGGALEGAVAEVDEAPGPVVAIAHAIAGTGAVAVEEGQEARQVDADLLQVGVIAS